MLDITRKPAHPLISASILSADFGRIADDSRDILNKGADLLHIDVMDGHFAPNLTMGQDMIAGLRRHFPDVFLDVHLMVERPEEYIDSFADAGANLFSFHLEVCHGDRDADDLIARIRDRGMHPGMVINPPTPPDGLEPYLSKLDLVLVMSVNPGRSGQAFMPEVLDKAKWVAQRIGEGTRLEMDGGVSLQTVEQVVGAGVDTLVTASALFGAEDRAGVIEQLHRA
jgi:ribulose-phosphate 3-epimerase